MSLATLGNKTSAVEITHISTHGIWLFAQDEEFFMSYEYFLWFKGQTVEAILNVEQLSQNHYHWLAIDIDLTKEIIKNPGRFPLKVKTT